ncbi:MAG: hypothetical protein LBD31_03500 [Treponema sp.]|jgi:uncharacterized DUF497 family protein|nr:hypothetical protein [Treponema sp.]
MEPEIVFAPSAFKHGISEAGIRWVLTHDPANGIIEEADETKYIAIGFDQAGNVLEIMYNHIDDETVKVFHAMKCRRQFRKQLQLEADDGGHDR